MTKMTSREQFEQKIQHEYGDDYLAVNDDGDYINWITSDLWEYWVASRAAVEIEIPEIHYFCDNDGAFVDVSDVIYEIQHVGLKVKA